MVSVQFEQNFASWRLQARELLKQAIPPSEVDWDQSQENLLFDESHCPSVSKIKPKGPIVVPPAFLKLAETVSCARVEERWDLLYRLLFRLVYENKNLLSINIDPDVAKALRLQKSISRDVHKMHAFVRFKKVETDLGETYVAWHQPEHLTLRMGAPFFVRRFGDRPWSIFTPDESAHWDLKKLNFSEGLPKHQFNVEDDFDKVWKTYYRSIYNPARINLKAMKQEMAPKYWAAMPESEEIYKLVRENHHRLEQMSDSAFKEIQIPPNLSMTEVEKMASQCTACPLYKKSTQLVWGEGSLTANLMIVGEQPGDQEDLLGRPFQGPAGRVLNECLQAAGIQRQNIYLTNAVKHFKWRPDKNKKKRLHQRPSGPEMGACKTWLEAEIKRIKPKVILALGRTAATAVLGRAPRISEDRQRLYSSSVYNSLIKVSWHPSAILRQTSDDSAAHIKQQLIFDLKKSLEAIQDKDCAVRTF